MKVLELKTSKDLQKKKPLRQWKVSVFHRERRVRRTGGRIRLW